MLPVSQGEQPVSTATIVVVTPVRLFRDVIQSVLQSQGHTVIGGCESFDQIVSWFDGDSSPDLVVAYGFGAEHSIELTASIRHLRSRTRAVKWIVIGPSAD